MAAALVAFFPGLALGSFLNVVAARVPLQRSVVRPASACMACEAPIAARDNIPLYSYLRLRGRCRACGWRIPLCYPAVELATALLVAGCFVRFGVSADAFVAAFVCAVLVPISAIDLERHIIPDRIVKPAAAIVLVAQTALHLSPEWAIGAVGAGAFLLVAAVVYPAGMGMGDVKLALLMGAALGRVVPVALMVGMVAALVPSAVLFARHGIRARKMGFPLGPFLALGTVVGLFAGHPLLDAYLKQLH